MLDVAERRASFIGIDLAWSARNPTGIARLAWHAGRRALVLENAALVSSDAEILEYVQAGCGATCVLGIDAPIIAPNPPGTGRPCDREVSRAFARFHAGAYPANREKCARPIGLCRRLKRVGFSPEPHLEPRRACRRQVEIFPHPAQVVLFRRDRIIKYKKGPVAERTAGLRELVGCIEQHLPHREPKLMLSRPLEQLLRTDVDALRGARRKGFEDRLDALVCAYMAGYYWYWGSERCRVYGDRANGYIVCPRLPGD